MTWLDCHVNKKWILYNSLWWPAQWLDREAPKHLTMSNLHRKRVIVIGGLQQVCSTRAFWILMEPLYLRSMLSKSMWRTKNRSACRQHWWDLVFSTTMPNCMLHNQYFKSWINWAMKFCLIRHIYLTSCHPATTSSAISTTSFVGNMLLQPQEAENAFQEFVKSHNMGFRL